MPVWKRLFGRATEEYEAFPFHEPAVINPATGLSMIDNTTGGVDVGGSPFGQDAHHGNHWSSQSGGN